MNKKMSKKLILSSETIQNLSAPDLQEVAGQATRLCSGECTATYVCSGCNPCA
jgi:hypothetical protein